MDHQIFMSRTQRRTLQSYTSGIYSLISGNASDTFHAEETVELIATTYDATNNLQTSGGDILIWELTQLDTDNSTVSSSNMTFVDNNDGTYSLTFSILQSGYISFSIYIYFNCPVWGYYWHNNDLSGDYDYFDTYDHIYFNWGFSNLTPNASDGVSTRFEGKIIAPETNTYTFLVHHDDGARLYIDNVMVFENWTSGAVSDTVDANLTLNQEYQIKLEHFESGGPGSLWLYWSYGSVS